MNSMRITILLGSNELTRSIKLSFTSELMCIIILTIISELMYKIILIVSNELTETIKLIPMIELMCIIILS